MASKKLILELICISLCSQFAFALGPVEVELGRRSVSPDSVNTFAAIDNSTKSFSSISEAQTFTPVYNSKGFIGILETGDPFEPTIHIGVFGELLLPKTIEQTGIPTGKSSTLTKSTTLSGYIFGPAAKFHIYGNRHDLISISAEAGIGIGSVKVSQTITNGSSSSLSSSAFLAEEYAEVSVAHSFTSLIDIKLGIGYVREKSNYLTVNSFSGSEYSNLNQDSRLQIKTNSGNQDFAVILSGMQLNLGVSFNL